MSELPIDCSGDPTSCPDNDGYGCFCEGHRKFMGCKRSHPHEDMADDCEVMTLIERQAVKAMSASYSDTKAIERAVMADHNRPCLYGVMGPCQHPKCLEAHFATLWRDRQASPAGKEV